MKHQKNKLIILSLILTAFLLTMIPQVSAADPEVSQILLDPEEPAATETIIFTATIESDDAPTSVYIVVQECKADICFKDGYNESLTLLDGNNYRGDVTLGRDDATYIKYHVEMLVNGIWYKNDITELDLIIDNGNGDTNGENGDTNGGNGNNNNTPGFELVALLIAGGILTIVLRRKRSR
jgi:hypothetical protein